MVRSTRQHTRGSKIIIIEMIFRKWLRHLPSTCFPRSSFTCITPFDAELLIEIKIVFKLKLKGIKQLLHPINQAAILQYTTKNLLCIIGSNISPTLQWSENVCSLMNPSTWWLGQAGGGRQKQIRLQWQRQSLCACCRVC